MLPYILATLCTIIPGFTRQNNTLRVQPTRYELRVTGISLIIQPLGPVDAGQLELLKEKIQQFYRIDAQIALQKPLPAMSYFAPRRRYKADSLLMYLKTIKPATTAYIIGVTAKDISTTKGDVPDWGVLGLGYMPGPCCVISTFRMKAGVSAEKVRDRLIKVALHELGHNFGLDHCPNKGCMMQDAEGTVKTVDNERTGFCTSCSAKIPGKQR